MRRTKTIYGKHRKKYNDNKEPILQRNREYNNTHKEQIKESFDKWNTESICPCGGKFHICKKNEHIKTKLHIYYVEHGTPKTYKGDAIQCECGGSYRSNQARHEQCKQHQEYIKSVRVYD